MSAVYLCGLSAWFPRVIFQGPLASPVEHESNFNRIDTLLEKARLSLAGARALPLLSLMGLFSGLLAGFVIILFRLLIEAAQAGSLPMGDPEAYEALGWSECLFIATAAGGCAACAGAARVAAAIAPSL